MGRREEEGGEGAKGRRGKERGGSQESRGSEVVSGHLRTSALRLSPQSLSLCLSVSLTLSLSSGSVFPLPPLSLPPLCSFRWTTCPCPPLPSARSTPLLQSTAATTASPDR